MKNLLSPSEGKRSFKRERVLRLIGHLVREGDDAPRQPGLLGITFAHTAAESLVRIGSVTRAVGTPRRPDLVPDIPDYLKNTTAQEILRHVQFLMKKDNLAQDVMLLGPPGPLRRDLVRMYCNITQRELEYMPISRDTTGSDLKQRREIRLGSALYEDQCVVRAAIHGRVLLLDGIEKAERNVLPIINNLMENREMALSDGCFLVNPTRYDELLETNTKESLDAQKLIRVSDDFRVVALSLPVPQYVGYPLDPPLRSRFQARYIDFLAPSTQLSAFRKVAARAPEAQLMKLLHVATVLRTAVEQEMESTEGMQAHVPPPLCASLNTVARLLELAPELPLRFLLDACYPYPNLPLCSPEQRSAVEALYKRFGIAGNAAADDSTSSLSSFVITAIEPADARAARPLELVLHMSQAADAASGAPSTLSLTVPAGGQRAFLAAASAAERIHPAPPPPLLPFIRTRYHDELLASLAQLHAVGDFCIIGPKGCGKSALLKQLGRTLGYRVEYLQLFQDMSARELLQRRATLPDGDTVWLPSRLVQAARYGRICVLDGAEQLPSGTISTLQQLLVARELALPDGSSLSLHLTQAQQEAAAAAGGAGAAAGGPEALERD
eukprot:g2044.t1